MNLKRRNIGRLFAFLAVLILLAHAVFPHHHHEEQVCLNLKHFHHTNKDSAKYPADCTHEHEHDSEDPVSNCILKQLVVVPAGQTKNEPEVLYLDNFTDCFILQAGYSYELQSTELFRKNSYPQDVPLFHSFLDYTQGLRAPPAV